MIARPKRRALPAAFLLLHLAIAVAMQRPEVFLFGASLSDARSFAIENAANRGWNILSVTSTGAVFEQVLEGEADEGFTLVQRLLRVFAEFREESNGIRVYLRAEELESPGTTAEWMTDVTARYAENLANALSSLRSKWDARREHSVQSTDGSRHADMGRLEPNANQSTSAPIGVWAYAAERYAQSRGCELSEQATQLASAGRDWEQHRVFCQDGSRVLVQCHYGDCTTRP